MNNTNNGFVRKRKTKKNHKNKNFKHKIFMEENFDSNDDVPSLQEKSESFVYQFTQVLNLTPSKSECDSFVSESSEVIQHSEEANVSCILTDNSFDVPSDEDIACSYGSVVDSFMNDSDTDKSAEIVAAEIRYKNEKLAELNNSIPPQKKKKKMKHKMKKSVPVKELINFQEYMSPPMKKSKVEKTPFLSSAENKFNPDKQMYRTGDGIVVILSKNQRVNFHGLCFLSVIHGQVEVLGHTLNKNSSEVKLYSTRGSSLLYLQNVTESEFPTTNYLLNLQIPGKIKLTDNCAVVICKKLHDPQILFVEKHISQQILQKEERNLPRIAFEPEEGSWNLMKLNPDWENIITGINNTTKMMICGGKGVGKTTFLRYAINKLLMRFSEVMVVDLDPGQSEFTMPGCISIVKVKKPIFGVNYTHLQEPERSILSNINIGYEPDKYIASVKQLLATRLDEIPTLINYMGYTHGIGINILSAVITCIQPSDILIICSQDPKKNYKFVLEKTIVEESARLFVPVGPQLNYNLYEIESMSDENDGWKAEPRQLREMCILSFVRRVIQSDSIFNTKASLFKIQLNDIKLSNLKGENIHPAVVNACLVALCRLENERLSIFQCFGWGIVRGVDSLTNEVILLTSKKLEILDRVTHLVSSGITLPPSVYMTPEEMVGPMPYVIEGMLMSLGQITKRSRIAVKSV